jgi:hypothetical protein
MTLPALAEDVFYDNTKTSNPSAMRTIDNHAYAIAPASLATPGNNVTIDYTTGTGTNPDPTWVFGGYSAGNDVISGNTATLKNGTVLIFFGGKSGSGNAEGNTATISGGTVRHDVYGAESNSGNAVGNTVTISGGSGGTAASQVYGGLSNSGNAVGNTVTISGGSLEWLAVYGGKSGSGNATGNTVTISGGTADSDVYGGKSDSGNATGNTVTISGGTVWSDVNGGNSNSGNATGNTVTLKNGLLTDSIFGGKSNGDATGNTVTISGGTVGKSVYGGLSNSSNAVGNTVTISGGSANTVLGGASDSGNATGNTVTISGGSVETVFGGLIYSSGNATGNTVTITGTANITSASKLYGGDSASGDGRTGNTLHIQHWRGSTSAEIANFENYRFTLPANVTSGQGILSLTSNGSVDLGTDAKIAVGFAGASTALRKGDTIKLIDASASTGVISGSLANTATTATLGATDYVFNLELDADSLTAHLETQINQDKASVYLYGATARMTALVNSADHTLTALENLNATTTTGFRSFVSIQGSSIKTRTGSSVDNNGVNLALGGAFDASTQEGTLTAALFAEGGMGRYNSDSRFGWGNGNTWHYGAGAFAKYAFHNRIYLEGSARVGRAKADFDGKGKVADLRYNSKGNYWGTHIGAGYDHPLNAFASLDSYAKLLWTRQESNAVTTHAKEKLSFDKADSLRSRIGTRYRHAVGKGLRAHAGIGWEYEFDGRGQARLNGTRIAHNPETKGHSALLETGVEWKTATRWQLNANLMGLFGQRKGISGFLQANYRFD